MNNILELILRLRDEASGALRAFTRAAEEARASNQSLTSSLAQVQRGLEGLGSSLGAIVGSAGLTYALKSAADTAFQAEAQMRVLARTAASVGQDFAALEGELRRVLQPLGVLPEQAASAAAQLLRAGYTTEQIAAAFQAGAASALAAGKTAQEGIENVAMALSTGQSIYLNYIGIAENIGPVMQKVASSMKGASEEAVRQAQAQAALNAILKATQQEVAALPDLLGGYAGAQNRLNLSLYEFRKAVGEAVLPHLTALINLANSAVNAFNSLDAETKRQVGTWAALSGGVLGASTALGMLLPVLRNTWTVVTGLGNALLWLVRSPIGLVITGVAVLVSAWASAGGDLEESRKRIGLLVQALQALYYGAKGTAEAVIGLFRNVGQTLAGVWAAISRAMVGDFAGAWQEVQKVLNLERWAANLQQANQDLARAGQLLSATWRGEVTPEARALQDKIRGLAERIQNATDTAQNAKGAMPNLAAGLNAVGTAAGEAAKKVKELDDATKSLLERAGMLTKSERERRQPRDWGAVDVEGALLEAQVAPYLEAQQTLLQNRAFEAAMARRMAEEGQRAAEQLWEAYADQTSALWSGGRAEQATINAIRRSFSSFGEAVAAGVDFDLAARAFISEFLERVERATEAAFSAAAPGYADVGAMISSGLLAGASGSWERFRQEMERQAAAAAQLAEEAARNQLRILGEVAQERERAGQIDIPGGLRELLQGPVYSILTAVQTGALDATEGIYALYDAAEDARRTLTALYEAGEITAEEFQRGSQSLALYEGAIADLRMQVLQSIGPIVELGNAVGEMGTGDFAPALTAAMSRLDEFRSYLDAIAEIEDPVERLRQLADLEGWLASAMPGLEELIRALEEAGIDADIVREVLETLVQRMRELGDESKRVQLDQEAQRWADGIRGATSALQGLSSGLRNIGDAFSAQTVGQGISQFAAGIGQIVGLIPGGQLIGGLIAAVGGLIGWLWDGIASVFDTGWERAQAKIREATANWKLVDPALAQRAVEQYTESYLFGLIQTTKYRVNEELLKAIQDAAQTAEGAVSGAIQAGLNAAARGEDWQEAIRQSLYSTTLNAVVNALMQSEAIKAALGPLTTALAEAILSGNAEAIAAATAALAQGMEALGPLFESLGQALGELLPRQLSEAEKSIQDLTASLEGGITGAVKSALQAGLRGEDWQAELSSRIREGILSAVVDAAVTQAVVQGALGPLIDGMVEAILTSNWQAVSTLSGMITTKTEVLVGGLLQGMHPLVSVFSDLSQSATRASESLERVAGSASNLPSWYRLEEVRGQATRTVVINVQGSIYGVDDLRRVLEQANAVGVYANTGGWR
ncbi:hypothetical protein [Thermus albus]|uniref:hypothetical protein n=1 Tax=Thermus albus TaxID=2908146 RepID=UPI001FAAD4B0|nr:hypothetical protein [Thermus albus]